MTSTCSGSHRLDYIQHRWWTFSAGVAMNVVVSFPSCRALLLRVPGLRAGLFCYRTILQGAEVVLRK